MGAQSSTPGQRRPPPAGATPPGSYPGQQAAAPRGGGAGGGGYPGQRMALPMQQSVLEGMRPEIGAVNGLRAPPNVPMRKTHTIRNDVNLKKQSLSLVADESHESRYHLEFQFDASTDCGISVYYAAKDHMAPDGSVTFTTLKPAGALPKEYRGKGLGQTYRTQASFALDVSTYQKPELTFTPAIDRFPIIVCLEAGGEAASTSATSKFPVSSQTTFANINLAGLAERKLKVAALKQKIQVEGASYELQEIYGIEGSGTAPADGGDAEASGASRECVICMTDPRDTTVLPCRHMCMCSECAKTLRMQSEKCPICRTPIESLLQIKVSSKVGGGDAADGPDVGQTPPSAPGSAT